jgi:hypothetical protein
MHGVEVEIHRKRVKNNILYLVECTIEFATLMTPRRVKWDTCDTYKREVWHLQHLEMCDKMVYNIW